MALVPRPSQATLDPNADANWLAGHTGRVDLTPSAAPAAPDAGTLIGAAFRQENIIGSLIAEKRAGGEADPTYNPWQDIEGTDYEQYWDRFSTVRNAGQTSALKQQIDMETNDRNTIAAAGGWGMVAAMGAGIFSPENLLPSGTIYREVKVGSAVLKTALSTASAAVLATAASELALHGSQQLRTPLESAFNIGGAALLGGMLGGGVSAVFSRADFVRLAKGMAAENLPATEFKTLADNEAAVLSGGEVSSLGAAARRSDTLDENTIAGKAAQVAGGAVHFLNPVLRSLHSPSAVMRDVATRLFENPVYMKKNMSGVASAPGVETLVKEYTQGAMARALEQANAIYGDFRKAGGQLDRAAFNEAVGRAMRRGDVGDDPHIGKAATAWRSAVFDPLKDAAIKAGLLPPDVSVETALSYLTRVYNKRKIELREPEFKAIVRRHIDRELRNAEIAHERWQLDPRGDQAPPLPVEMLSEADRGGYIEEIVDHVFNSVTGRNVDSDLPRNIVATTRGPLKERTLNIPDSEIEDFLESNVEAVARRYARTMAADIELTNAFGSADLKAQIEEVKQSYAQLRAAVDADAGPGGVPLIGKPMTDAQKQAAIKQLVALEKSDIGDLRALRDLIRGAYKVEENSSKFARVARVAGTANYLRTMGGVTLSSITDVGRHIMVHGFSNVMRDGLVPLITNLKAFKMSVAEAKLAGAVTERLLNTRMATWADLTDPYAMGSPFERFMDNTATGFSKLTGMTYWNDFQKSFASVITQNRVLRGAGDYGRLGAREKAYLAFLGIDEGMAERIARQFEEHGTLEDGGVRVASTDDWTDDWARRVYRAAINKDVDSTIVTKGVGDVPLFMHTPAGKLIGQFKGFALASHQRVLMRGLQERQAGFVAGSALAVTVGMMIYYLKSIEANRAEDISDNPGRWVAEGVDRSGILSIAFEVNNTVEKAFGIGAYGALARLFPDAEQSGKASKYMQRGISETLIGPTGALLDALVAAGNAMKPDGKWSQSEINAIKKLIPGATLPGIRSLVEYLGMPAVEQAMGVH